MEQNAELQRKVDELQRLKFGGAVNIEAMESHGINEVRGGPLRLGSFLKTFITIFFAAGRVVARGGTG